MNCYGLELLTNDLKTCDNFLENLQTKGLKKLLKSELFPFTERFEIISFLDKNLQCNLNGESFLLFLKLIVHIKSRTGEVH